MPIHIYCCAECGHITSSVVTPKTENCPDFPFHRWINIGTEGNEEYLCVNCKVSVHTSKPPITYGCKEHIFHEWRKI